MWCLGLLLVNRIGDKESQVKTMKEEISTLFGSGEYPTAVTTVPFFP